MEHRPLTGKDLIDQFQEPGKILRVLPKAVHFQVVVFPEGDLHTEYAALYVLMDDGRLWKRGLVNSIKNDGWLEIDLPE